MTRESPELKEARRQIDVLQRMMTSYREEWKLADVPTCGDNSCVCKPPRGMATNGGCRCTERDLRRAVLWYRHEYARLRAAAESGAAKALADIDSALAHIKASGHAGSAIMSREQILAWAAEIGWVRP